jgi:hypothetical protein
VAPATGTTATAVAIELTDEESHLLIANGYAFVVPH